MSGQFIRRLCSVGILFAAAVLVYAVMLVRLQIAGQDYYTMSSAVKLTTRTVTVKAQRGEIFDRNGTPLVTNKYTYDLRLDGGSIGKTNREKNDLLLRLRDICGDAMRSPDAPFTASFEGDDIYFHYTVMLNGKLKDSREILKGSRGLKGHRNSPIPAERIDTRAAKLGEPIDLLKDGLAGWETIPGKGRNCWSFKDGTLSNDVGLDEKGQWKGGGLNLRTKRADFTDFNLEYDVRVATNSNSGVYLRGRYEIQTVDSFKARKPDLHSMGAYYGRVAPCAKAEKKPGEWQHVNVTLYKGHLTVWLNGVNIIRNAPVTGITGGALDAEEEKPGPIYVQGDHSNADYRNMVLRPVRD